MCDSQRMKKAERTEVTIFSWRKYFMPENLADYKEVCQI